MGLSNTYNVSMMPVATMRQTSQNGHDHVSHPICSSYSDWYFSHQRWGLCPFYWNLDRLWLTHNWWNVVEVMSHDFLIRKGEAGPALLKHSCWRLEAHKKSSCPEAAMLEGSPNQATWGDVWKSQDCMKRDTSQPPAASAPWLLQILATGSTATSWKTLWQNHSTECFPNSKETTSDNSDCCCVKLLSFAVISYTAIGTGKPCLQNKRQ